MIFTKFLLILEEENMIINIENKSESKYADFPILITKNYDISDIIFKIEYIL